MCLAIPGRVVSIDKKSSMMSSGKVDFGGVLKEINLSCVPEVAVGDYVIVHAGFAISIVDEFEAQKTFEYLEQMQRLGNSDEIS